VIAFDASHGMVKMCRQYPFAYCLHRSFEQILFVEEFDAVWACASLIHLSFENLREALFRLFNALKPGGYIYFSLKMNDGKGVDSDIATGRQFYYYSEDKIVRLADEDLALELIKKWTNRGKKESDSSDWTNFLYRKSRSISQVKGISQ